MKIFGLPGTSFSPRRAIGVDVLKRSIAKKTGVPLTKSGVERKIGIGGLPLLGIDINECEEKKTKIAGVMNHKTHKINGERLRRIHSIWADVARIYAKAGKEAILMGEHKTEPARTVRQAVIFK